MNYAYLEFVEIFEYWTKWWLAHVFIMIYIFLCCTQRTSQIREKNDYKKSSKEPNLSHWTTGAHTSGRISVVVSAKRQRCGRFSRNSKLRWFYKPKSHVSISVKDTSASFWDTVTSANATSLWDNSTSASAALRNPMSNRNLS